jgi:hypothetical protein
MDKIPAVKVVEWKVEALFGTMKATWVLPPVPVTIRPKTRAERRLQMRIAKRITK